MATVWLFTRGHYSDYRVVGVFSSREHAQQVADAHEWDWPNIIELPLDPAVHELHQGLSIYSVQMQEDGAVISVSKESFSIAGLTTSVHISTDRKYGPIEVLNATVWAEDEAHAIKIVNEHRARMIASR